MYRKLMCVFTRQCVRKVQLQHPYHSNYLTNFKLQKPAFFETKMLQLVISIYYDRDL